MIKGVCIYVNNNIDENKLKKSMLYCRDKFNIKDILVNIKLKVNENGDVNNDIDDNKLISILNMLKELNLNINIFRISHDKHFKNKEINKNIITNSVEWYKHYIDIIKYYDTKTFSLTNEYIELTSNEDFIDLWKGIINELKGVTNCLNYTFDYTYYELKKSVLLELQNVIHVHCYTEICINENTNDLSLLTSNWIDTLNYLRNINKNIIITETGCQPFEGRLASPCTCDKVTKENDDIQYKYYDVTIPLLNKQNWLKGVYLWESNYIAESYSPFGRKAESVISKYWS